MSTNGRYEKLATPCDFCRTSLEECLIKIGPAFVYEVRCALSDTVWMRSHVRKIMADVEGSPLAPYINLVPDYDYGRDEWSVHANGLAVGSAGV